MTAFLKWLVVNGSLLVALYFGWYIAEPNQGVQNIFLAVQWTAGLIVVLLSAMPNEIIQGLGKKPLNRSVPDWLDKSYDLVILLAMLYVGLIATSVMYFISQLAQATLFKRHAELLAAKEAAQPGA